MAIECDVIIIGGGPGGYETAIEAARGGLKVILFERDRLGGTCLNRGCIPTKALCRAAEALHDIRNADEWGITVGEVSADYSAAHKRMLGVVDMLREGISAQLAGVEVIHADARLTEDGNVIADNQSYSADKIIIATGSRPARLPIPGADLAMTSDELLALDTLPASIVIIGGGVIGLEFAGILNAYGVEVTVVEYCKEVLPPFDPDIAKRLRSALSRQGIKFIVGAAVTSIAKDGDQFAVTYTGKKGEASLTAQSVLMATGRCPVFPQELDKTDVEFTPKGIVVNDDMMTTMPGVYAIGDVNGRCMLAHAATAQGRKVLGDNINLDIIPSAVFTQPEAAMVGMTEAKARAAYGDELRVRSVLYGASGKAVAMGETFGVVKMLTVGEGSHARTVGCSILGAHASDLIAEVAVAMNVSDSATLIADTIHAHPTLSELVMMAAK